MIRTKRVHVLSVEFVAKLGRVYSINGTYIQLSISSLLLLLNYENLCRSHEDRAYYERLHRY